MEFNHSAEWAEFVERLEPVLEAIGNKLTSNDWFREDAVQAARIELYQLFPERIRKALRKEIPEERWLGFLTAYVRRVARYTMIDHLDSHKTGDWATSRRRKRRDGTWHRVPPRATSLDHLRDEFGFDVDNSGNISWLPRDDGLEIDTRVVSQPPWAIDD